MPCFTVARALCIPFYDLDFARWRIFDTRDLFYFNENMILIDHISAFIRHCWSGLWGNEEKTALSTFDLKASCDNDSLLFVVYYSSSYMKK